MLGLLPLVPALPFVGFVVLALFGPRLSRPTVAVVGIGSVGLSAAIALLIAGTFLGLPDDQRFFTTTVWTWMDVGGTALGITLDLDALSLLMMLVVTVVSFLIHLYSAQFMEEEEGYSRYFAYMNLFVGSMLVLVLAGNLALLLLGWEGVGLCSYLLIGFWYQDPANGRAARKAFVVTRIGDTALLIGIFLLFHTLGTLDIQDLMVRAPQQWAVGSGIAALAALLLLVGAVGKSAQLPLQTWLPDAMAGPTPVSALIHAATMVTAGVYLIARTNALFSLAPSVQQLVGVVGAVTMVIAGFSALVQWDIKRVLAYSTISQIGLMFVALGVGAWTAAMFHFFTHAFFKALLFLGAGVIIYALHHETDMRRMGGLRGAMPLTFWTFLAGAAALSAIPLITSGFYSKDAILFAAWAAPLGSSWLWGAGALSAFLTALYTFRLVFLTFFGPRRHEPDQGPDLRMAIPLVLLAAASLVAGFVETPATLGSVHAFSNLLHSAVPALDLHADMSVELPLQLATSFLSLAGVLFAFIFYLPRTAASRATAPTGQWGWLRRFWFAGWGFDWLYDNLIVRPFVWYARANRDDIVDLLYQAVAAVGRVLNRALSYTQNGRVRWYALGMATGAAIIVAIGVFGGLL